MPVIGVVDTNHSPEGIDYVIPGNDDSSRAIRLYARGMADAVLEGRTQSLEEVVARLARRVRRGGRRGGDEVDWPARTMQKGAAAPFFQPEQGVEEEWLKLLQRW